MDPASSAVSVCSTVRPIVVICDRLVGSSDAGVRSPESDSSTDGSPAAPNGACSVGLIGKARWASCPPSPVLPAAGPDWADSAAASVLRSIGGATSREFDHGTTTGPWTLVPARSPSVSTASTGCGKLRASRAAPTAPADPVVEAITMVCCSDSPDSTRAISSSTAVPDNSAVLGELSESRWATTTMLPLPSPARIPTTFSSVRGPTAVFALNVSVETLKFSCRSVPATADAMSSSPTDPGRRFGYCAASRCIVAYAFCGL